METFFSISETLRWAGVLQLFFLAFFFLRHRSSGIYAAFFCLTLVCYLSAAAALERPILTGPVLFGAFAVAWALWILSQAIFDDAFKFQGLHLVLLIVIELVSFASFIARDKEIPELLQPVRRLFPQLINLGLMVLTIIHAQQGARHDLLEDRRRFRSVLTIVSGVYVGLVLISEIAWKENRPSRLAEALNVSAVTGLVFYFSFRLMELKPNFFLGRPSSLPTEAERSLGARIESLMKDQRLFIREDLNAGHLSELLGEQEYKIRRTINGVMGYRNFYDFLNAYRIKEACRILADSAQASVPVLRIAMECGYGSLAPFNRAFKAAQGMSPTEFRRVQSQSRLG